MKATWGLGLRGAGQQVPGTGPKGASRLGLFFIWHFSEQQHEPGCAALVSRQQLAAWAGKGLPARLVRVGQPRATFWVLEQL